MTQTGSSAAIRTVAGTKAGQGDGAVAGRKAGRRRRLPRLSRLGVVVAGVAAAVVVWALAHAVVANLRTPGFNNAAPQPLSATAVVATSLLGGLLAWLALAAVERTAASRPRLWFVAVAAAGFALSLAGPLSGAGIGVGDRTALILLHLSVAAVVIPGLNATVGAARPADPEPGR